MANGDILSELNASDIAHFKKDFVQMIKVGAEIDRYYAEAHRDLDRLIPKYEKILGKFNKKYKGIKISVKKTIDVFKVRIFVRVRDIKEFFANSASRISGLKSVGRASFNQVDVSNVEKFAQFLDLILDKIYISYLDPESGTSTLAAILDRREKMIEIICRASELMNESSAGFKVCAFYALKGGFDRKIEVYGDASTFGFFNLLDEIEKREWYDKFNPRFFE